MEYILAHDLGTSGDKAVLFTLDGSIVAEHTEKYETQYSDFHRAEQASEDWWDAFCISTKKLIDEKNINPSNICAVSFSAQMNCCLPVDASGNPMRNAMIWADGRAMDEATAIINVFGIEKLYELTGHRIGPSYSIAKMMWYRKHEFELYKRTAKFLQVKDFIICRLTGEMLTDYSDASHLGCLDQAKKKWSADVLSIAGIDADLMPEIIPSTAVAGFVRTSVVGQCGLVEGTPVVVGGGDGCCATTGAGVFNAGQVYNVIGSSSWIATLSPKPIVDMQMRTFNFIHLDGMQYVQCGTMQSAGFALQWAVDTLFGSDKAENQQATDEFFSKIGEKVQKVEPGSKGLIFLPYLLGERSPWWNPDAKACFIGLTPQHRRNEMLRSVMEGVGYNLRVILDLIESNVAIDEIRIIGGAARNAFWVQMLSDIWQRPLEVAENLEYATSIGAAVCAGVGIGAFKDFSICASLNSVRKEILPNLENKAIYDKAYDLFQRLYRAIEPVCWARPYREL